MWVHVFLSMQVDFPRLFPVPCALLKASPKDWRYLHKCRVCGTVFGFSCEKITSPHKWIFLNSGLWWWDFPHFFTDGFSSHEVLNIFSTCWGPTTLFRRHSCIYLTMKKFIISIWARLCFSEIYPGLITAPSAKWNDSFHQCAAKLKMNWWKVATATWPILETFL